MSLELFITSGSEAGVITLQEDTREAAEETREFSLAKTPEGSLENARANPQQSVPEPLRETVSRETVPPLQFRFESPVELVLCFMNRDYSPLLSTQSQSERRRQIAYFRETFAQTSLGEMREFINHVLVCETARGFDPVIRLAAYSYAGGSFGFAGGTESRELEASVVGQKAAARMSQRWGALMREHSAPGRPRETLFEALLEDAAMNGYPFELGVSTEYESFAHLLRVFAEDMVAARQLLRRCPVCRRYAIAEALPFPCGCGQHETAPAPGFPAENPEADAAERYRQVYSKLANRARHTDEAKTALERFEAESRDWQMKIRHGDAEWEAFGEWLKGQ